MLNKNDRFMRLIVFFDLPTKTKQDKRVYTVFRRYLLKDGFIMLQFSVYSRVCKGLDSVESHLKYLKSILPPKGNIRMLQVTEKQYARMEILLGSVKKTEKSAGKQLLLF
ncbi:MAG: CRISPR-associated endonuclease Cas2 [Gammaproteobacteria bacterium]|uniref:CRISPR-associated endoribonuclease Cas2 n=1 Tax=endosymbiont of Bathymodiolus septemdierum str. Myojin knoll TaxID=1303921 RepID=A0A0P0USN3_9GAMM|nr:CRISPR-associated endonuclease Cas2 [Bathymodiolus septemdierum thioautotrophic gill symbiont]RUA05901.1 MAG: CRISPR-associated endonuclease Cas2 [Gammaproteobacteria bacterium]BAS68108.1 CRISP-associated protein Cas2 [endosymbiont of Bathymodiolus septemdierum str. Myojin knoll]